MMETADHREVTEARPEELHMREGESGHRRQHDGQKDADQGDEHGVTHLQPVTLAQDDVAVIGPLPFGRQAEGIAAKISEGLEPAKGGRKERHDDDRSDDDQARIDVDACPQGDALSTQAGLSRRDDGGFCISHFS